MTEHSAGRSNYTVDVVYPSAFGAFQAPVHLAYAAAVGGRRAPAIDAPFTYADLGCGAGLTLCVLADCYPHAEFHGIDLNPDHIAAGQLLAKRAGLTNVAFHQLDFADLATAELPRLDFAALSGVYSWLDAATRSTVLGAAARLLKQDGLVFLHYGALPGNNQIDSLYALIRELAADIAGDSLTRFEGAIARARRLAAVEAIFFRANPYAHAWLDNLGEQDSRSLAHDVLNSQRASLSVRDASNEAADRGLTYVANAQIEFNNLALVAPPALRADLASLPVIGREMMLDAVRNAHSRMDVYARPGESTAFADAGGGMILDRLSTGALLPERSKLEQASSAAFTSEVYGDVLAALDGHALTVAVLLADPILAAYPSSLVIEATQHMIATKLLHVMHRPYAPVPTRRSGLTLASRLNRLLLEEQIDSAGQLPLASPIAGTQLLLPPADRLALLSIVGGDFNAAWVRIQRAGQRINQNGRPVMSAAGLAEVAAGRAAAITATMVPSLSRFGILSA